MNKRLLKDMKALVGQRVCLQLKKGNYFECRLSWIGQSAGGSERWIAIIDNGMSQVFDIFAEIRGVRVSEFQPSSSRVCKSTRKE